MSRSVRACYQQGGSENNIDVPFDYRKGFKSCRAGQCSYMLHTKGNAVSSHELLLNTSDNKQTKTAPEDVDKINTQRMLIR